MGTERLPRRDLLSTFGGIVALGGLAGCLSDGDGHENGEPTDDTGAGGDEFTTELTAQDWTLPNADVRNTRHHPKTTGPKTGQLTETVLYEDDVDNFVIKGDTAYVQENGGNVIALDKNTGEEQWSDEDYTRYSTSDAVIHREKLYVTRDETAVAFDLDLGEQVWSTDLTDGGEHSLHTIVPVDDELYVVDGERIHRLDTETGAEEIVREEFAPHIDLDHHEMGGMIVDGDTLYLSSNERVAAFDRETGDEKWRYRTSAFSRSYSISKSENTILWGNRAIDADTGDELWTIEVSFPRPTYSTVIAVADGMLFGNFAQNFQAYDIETGEQEWSIPSTITSPNFNPVVADGIGYITDGSTIYAVEIETGDEMFTYESDTVSRLGVRNFLVSEGVVYATSNSTLYTYEEA